MKFAIEIFVSIIVGLFGASGWYQYLDSISISELEVHPKEEIVLNIGEALPVRVNAIKGSGTISEKKLKFLWKSSNDAVVKYENENIIGVSIGRAFLFVEVDGNKNAFGSKLILVHDSTRPIENTKDSTNIKVDVLTLPLENGLIYLFNGNLKLTNCVSKLENSLLANKAKVTVTSASDYPDKTIIKFYFNRQNVINSANLIKRKLKKLGINATVEKRDIPFPKNLITNKELIEVWFGKKDNCKT